VDVSAWDVGAIGAKALSYAATLGAAGGIFFLFYTGELLDPRDTRRSQRLLGWLLLMSAFGSAIRILLLTGSMSGNFGGMFDRELVAMIWRAGEGRSGEARIIGLLLCVFALSSDRRFRIPALVGATLASTSFAWVGHVHALQPKGLPAIASGLHLLGVAFWLGALPLLLMIARDDEPPRIASIAVRFGNIALGVVATLIAAGLTLLWLLSTQAPAFWSSPYGRMIAVKLFLVGLLLAAAAVNKLILTPRLKQGDTAALRSLRRSIGAEIALGILILILTAWFTTAIGPPHA
jgi:copper resistance protein D